jgi:hypothetical protein
MLVKVGKKELFESKKEFVIPTEGKNLLPLDISGAAWDSRFLAASPLGMTRVAYIGMTRLG